MTRMIPILFFVALTGCEAPVTEPSDTLGVTDVQTASTAMSHSEASFELWKQGFEHGTDGWVTDATPGPMGWCGEIETVARGGEIAPSAGRAHATVQQGACNDYWQENGFAVSGPYSAGAGYSEAWPTGGYVTELDVYLDPSWTADEVFTLAFSINLLDQAFPTGFRYFMVPVAVGDDGLHVAGHAVDEAGWYTFRYTARGQDGQLALGFELTRHGQVLFGMPLTTTAFSGEAASSFPVDNVGSGYIWFAAIADEVALAIDEHRVRRGR